MDRAKKILEKLFLRPTAQRLAIMKTLLSKSKIHVTAYSLEKMLLEKDYNISKATIYNNLNELSDKGFLKKVLVEKDKMWFDTNLSEHHHFYDEEEDSLVDIEEKDVAFSKLPNIPEGKILKSIDIIINIKKN